MAGCERVNAKAGGWWDGDTRGITKIDELLNVEQQEKQKDENTGSPEANSILKL
jgi:hypothetical protein